MKFSLSFRGASAASEPGIQRRIVMHLDSGSAPFGASRNDSKFVNADAFCQ
jgi:hypothetical protein